MSLRTVFFGTPDFAIPTLKTLHESPGIELTGILTQPDRPSGRGKRLAPPPVKSLALEFGLDCIQPEKLKDPVVLPWLQKQDPDVIVVVAYGGFVPKPVRELTLYGCVNLHPSLLPKYRGAAPVQWAIMNGDRVTGNSTMYLSQGWDDGDVIYQEEELIFETDTYGSLSERLSQKGAALMLRSLHDIAAGTAPRIPQDHDRAVMAPQIDKKDARIDWTRTAWEIHNQVRGMNPTPGAFTKCDGQRLKVLRTEVISDTPSQPGTVVGTEFRTIRISASDAIVEIHELQPEGKRVMMASDFLRGRAIATGTVCESA